MRGRTREEIYDEDIGPPNRGPQKKIRTTLDTVSPRGYLLFIGSQGAAEREIDHDELHLH